MTSLVPNKTSGEPDRVEWMIRCLVDEKKFLNPWETNFLSSIAHWYEIKGWVTGKQLATLERVYKEAIHRPAFNLRRGWRERE